MSANLCSLSAFPVDRAEPPIRRPDPGWFGTRWSGNAPIRFADVEVAPMAKCRSSRVPKFRKQQGKPYARAFVELSGKRHYLGRWGTEASQREYARILAEWQAGGGHPAVPAVEITVSELVARYVRFAKGYWKSWVHERLGTPEGTPGALTFFHAPPRNHYFLVRHLTAERQIRVAVAGAGDVIRWERIRRNNHYLDCAYLAAAAAHACSVRLLGPEKKETPVTDYFARRRRSGLTTTGSHPHMTR